MVIQKVIDWRENIKNIYFIVITKKMCDFYFYKLLDD